jgi:hypothetical protein
MTIDELRKKLRKKKSPRFIVIDSVQYWFITLKEYWELKKEFGKKKSFIFISHSEGKEPDGKLAKKIRFDVPVKVHVMGLIAFVKSRFGGNNPFVIWEQGAKEHWGAQFAKVSKRKYPIPTREDIEKILRQPVQAEQPIEEEIILETETL